MCIRDRYLVASPAAASSSTPVGSPFSSLSSLPPLGSGVSLVIPIIFIAALLTQAPWASA